MEVAETTALSALKPGEVGRVASVDGDDVMALRLRDLGFWPDTRVECVRRAPFGDPAQFRLRGYTLALRVDEALRVNVLRETD